MFILLTGATGYVGGRLLNLLEQQVIVCVAWPDGPRV